MNLKNLLLSALHNGTAAAAATIAPAAISLVEQGPTGNALTYAQAHPWVLGIYAIGAMIFRDALKNVPAFNAVANPAPPATSGK